MHSRLVVFLLAFAIALPGVALSQETTSGSIAGQVLDAQGQVVPGATVTITSEQGTRSFVSDTEGRFFVPFLTPGVYAIRVELSGFAPVEQKNILIRLGQRTTLIRSMPTAAAEAAITLMTFDPAVSERPRVLVATAVADPVAGSATVMAVPPFTCTCTVWAVALA